MRHDCHPTFFVIGAPKCGTTSLHLYLDQHPAISMSRVKEPNVFSAPLWMPRLPGYDGQFDCGAPVRGDASTSYTRFPAEGDAAPAIHRAHPDAKLIYLVRDPVERAVSDYVHHASAGHEPRSIDEALRDFTSRENYYVCPSRYAMQVGRYLERFPASALLVIEQSALRERREETLREVFGFLGVEAGFASPEFGVELLSRHDYVSHGGVAWRLRQSGLARAFRRLPARYRLPIARGARRVAGATPQPRLDPGLRAELADFLRAEVEELERMVGRPLAGLAPAQGVAP